MRVTPELIQQIWWNILFYRLEEEEKEEEEEEEEEEERKEKEGEKEEEEEKKDSETELISVQSLGSVVKEMMFSHNQEYIRESI